MPQKEGVNWDMSPWCIPLASMVLPAITAAPSIMYMPAIPPVAWYVGGDPNLAWYWS